MLKLRIFVLLLASMFMSFGMGNVAAAQTVSLGVTPNTFEVIKEKIEAVKEDQAIIDRQSCPALESEMITDAGRPFVELTIICNAIFESKLADKIVLIHHLPHSRRLSEIASGLIDVSASTIFPEGLKNIFGDNKPLLSVPALRDNEFEKAIYTLAYRSDVMAVRSLSELQNFRGVTNKFWQVDMKTLEAMKLKSVVGVSKASTFVKMIKGDRADFTISEYSQKPEPPSADDLVMVPGIKVALASPRVFAVSPQRNDILQAINKFIEKSRSGNVDLIKRAYQQSRFFIPEISNWKLVFPVQ